MRSAPIATTITVEDIAIEVVPKRIRHMHLRVYAPGDRVCISAPLRMSVETIRGFATSRLDWIRKHQRQLRDRQPAPPRVPVSRAQRAELLSEAQALVSQWERVIEVSVDRISLRSMRTRWGSCTPRARRIRLSVALAHQPRECLEYVVVHELVHMLEASHNRRFVALMDRFLPDWRRRKRILNTA